MLTQVKNKLELMDTYIVNPYSVLTPPGGFLYFPKIINLSNILLFTTCKNNKYLILYEN